LPRHPGTERGERSGVGTDGSRWQRPLGDHHLHFQQHTDRGHHRRHRGTITIPGIYYRPGGFTVVSGDQEITLSYEEPAAMYAYLGYEAAETARRIVAGETSTPYRPMADTVSTLEIIDEVRRQIGIVFPGEQTASA
jgi:hypothetical protein